MDQKPLVLSNSGELTPKEIIYSKDGPQDNNNENNKKKNNNLTNLQSAEIERQKFIKHSPLITLLIFCIGSCTTLVQVTCEATDQYQVTVRFKDQHIMHLYGFANIIVQVYIYIGSYFLQCVMCSIPNLIGQGLREEACHLLCDFYRFSFGLSIVFPLCFYWAIEPFLKFVGCPEDSVRSAINFVLPPTIAMFVICFFFTTIGYFMAIGRSELAAFLRCGSYIMQTAFFTPLMLFAIKIPTSWIRSAMVWAQTLATSICLYLIFSGKFTLKPKITFLFRNLFKKFSPYFSKSLLTGLPIFFQFLCLAVPPTLILQSLTSSVKDQTIEIAAVFGVFNRITCYTTSFPCIFTDAFLTVGTHAFGGGDMKRLKSYFLWTLSLGTILITLMSIIMVMKPRAVASIFLHTEEELVLSETILKVPYYTAILQPFIISCNCLLIILGRPFLALLGSGLQTILLSCGCKAIQYLFPSNPLNVMYVYNLTDIVLFFVYLLLMIQPLKKVKKGLIDLNTMTTTSVIGDNDYIVLNTSDPLDTTLN